MFKLKRSCEFVATLEKFGFLYIKPKKSGDFKSFYGFSVKTIEIYRVFGYTK